MACCEGRPALISCDIPVLVMETGGLLPSERMSLRRMVFRFCDSVQWVSDADQSTMSGPFDFEDASL